MIVTLNGTAERLGTGEVRLKTGGVGYLVHVPIDVWERIEDGEDRMLWIHTYVREERFDLFGFADKATRALFGLLIAQSGIGPKTALELCAVPKSVLVRAAHDDDVKTLTNVKGIGKKTAEKLLVELRSLMEKQPHMFADVSTTTSGKNEYDQDAVSALVSLGYDTSSVLEVLKRLPENLGTTEERVTAALRTL